MFKYAEIYGGKVISVRESHLSFVEFCSIYDPTIFWVDVTGIEDIAEGYVIKADNIKGTYFENPYIEEDTTSLEYQKNLKLELLDTSFQKVQDNAYVKSSLGFTADAGNRANRDITGLIKRMDSKGEQSTIFRDYNNIFQIVSLDELKTLELEIIENGQYIYQQKWEKEKAISEANSIEELEPISTDFEMLDFFTIPYEEEIDE